MSGDWVVCKHCSLKYRVRENVCPRCDKPVDDAQPRWTDQRGTAGPPSAKTSLALPLGLSFAAAIAAALYFVPAGFFNSSLQQQVARACEERPNPDCDCVGTKTVELMTAEQRAAPFDAQEPELRELMLTAAQLCLKARFVRKCRGSAVDTKTETQCICMVDGAVNAFTPAELDETYERQTPPARYAAIRAGCQR